MCESDVYVSGPEGERLLMKEAAKISVEGDEVVVRGLLGEERRLRARIRDIDLVGHKVLLEEG